MQFLDHTLAWARGEAFEMSLLATAGVVVLVVAGLMWRFAPTPVGQALPIPLVVVALIFLAGGLGGSIGSQDRLADYAAAFNQDPVAFVHAEKARVEAFEALYTYTLIGAAVAFAAALALFVFSEHATLRAIAVALVFLGLSALIVDMFSKERAVTYANAIEAEIEQTTSSTAESE
ncbi:hypothetical protein [Ruegeria sp.]|uniref:hypothetical protein n=1 Tax=Ruegeria sp. TaxID=1879320 RepID=UPI003B5B6121